MLSPLRAVKVAIWIYFWLLILEGTFRKWIFPEFSDLFFVIRDPVVVIIYLLAWRAGVFPRRPALIVIWILTVLALVFSFGSEPPLLVTLFGLRTDFLHLPLIFIMAAVLDRDDVWRFGRAIMWLSPPIVLLMIAQFNADPHDWINATAGGGESQQLHGALGKIRPPGPFSFVTGTVAFFGLAAAYVSAGWLSAGRLSRRLLLVGTLATIVAVPISISRSLLMAVLIVLAFTAMAVTRDLRRVPRLIGMLTIVICVLAAAWNTIYLEAFATRWVESSESGNGFYSDVVMRMVDFYLEPFTIEETVPLLGHGLGVGTIAGARLMTGGYSFLLGESEHKRLILELGPILGWAFIAWRTWLASLLVWRGWRRLKAFADPLAWLLAAATFLGVFNGQWGPATQLGFAVFGAGLTLAALNDPQSAETEEGGEIAQGAPDSATEQSL